jgi:DNA polymerase-3 subunit alpha
VAIYQEQLMEISKRIGGFTPSQADDLRKAIGKKIKAKMEQLEPKFREGAGASDTAPRAIDHLWSLMQKAGDYSFNKSHAACYALISYRTAYLKAKFPVQYMAALISSVMDTKDKVPFYVNVANEMGIEVLPPDINAGRGEFAVEGQGIRYGLGAIKGAGERALELIVAARESGGKFRSLHDFCERVDARGCNRAVVEALIKAGAFDSLGARRAQLSEALDAAMAAGAGFARDRASGQLSLLGGGGGDGGDGGTAAHQAREPELPQVPEWPENKFLEFEKAVLGFYLTRHPLARHERLIRGFSTAGTAKLESMGEGSEVTIGGLIAGLKHTVTKKDGKRMARVTLEDLDGTVEAVAFPQAYDKYSAQLAPDSIVFLKGRVNRKLDRLSVVINEVIPLAEARVRLSGAAVLRLSGLEVTDELLAELTKLLAEHPGQRPMYLQVTSTDGSVVDMRAGNGGVKLSEDLYADLAALVGEERVEFLPEGR